MEHLHNPLRLFVSLVCFVCCLSNAKAQFIPIVDTPNVNYFTNYFWIEASDPEVWPIYDSATVTNDSTVNGIFAQYDVQGYMRAFPSVKDTSFKKFHVIFFSTGSVDSFVNELNSSGKIDTAYKRGLRATACESPPNDGYISGSNIDNGWYLNSTDALCAWSLNQGDPRISISYIDAAYHSHPDLDNKVIYTVGTHGGHHPHGTSVIGMASAIPNNNIGIAGIGHSTTAKWYYWGALPHMMEEQFILAWEDGAKIINGSIIVDDDIGVLSRESAEKIAKTTLIVFAAGNGNASGVGDASTRFHEKYADIPGIIIVSSVGRDGKHAAPSGFETHHHNDLIDLCAPGYELPVLIGNDLLNPSTQYAIKNGTSFAAPLVAGTAALMLNENPCLTPAELEEILKATTDPISDAASFVVNGVSGTGTGQLNAYEAVAAARQTAVDNIAFSISSTQNWTTDREVEGNAMPR